MARLQHAQIRTYAGKIKADDNSQRNSQASDKHAFEKAMKVASSEKSEKIDNTIGSTSTSEFAFNFDEKDERHRYIGNSVLTASSFQSAQYEDPDQANSGSVLESRTLLLRDFYNSQSHDSAICSKTLDELSDWLDGMIDRDADSAADWTFEFETDDAQLVELQLVCQQDGQWSAN